MCATDASRNIAAARRGSRERTRSASRDEPLVGRDRRAAPHLDVPAQPLGVGGEQRVVGERGGLVEQAAGALGLAAADRVTGRGEQPAGARLAAPG